jgi:hypothetical protein
VNVAFTPSLALLKLFPLLTTLRRWVVPLRAAIVGT